MIISLNLAISQGILIKNQQIFDKMKKTQAIFFDKTGTLFTKINTISEITEIK